MSFSITTARKDYTGDGVTTVYAYDFPIQQTSHLRVTKATTASPPVETTLTEGVDYSVSGAGSATGGNVTLTAAITNGHHLTFRRILTLNQQTDIRNQGAFFPEIHEDAFDQFVMMIMQLQEQINRALTFQPTSTKSGYTMADPVANKALRWNSTGTAIELYDPTAAGGIAYTAPSNPMYSTDADVQTILDHLHPKIHGSTGSPTNVVAGTAIAADAAVLEQTWFVQGSGGPVTVSANPQIVAGTKVGQKLRLYGCSDANTLKYANGTGLKLNRDCTLGIDTILKLFWNGTDWAEEGRANDLP
jgi:hypothetical protein